MDRLILLIKCSLAAILSVLLVATMTVLFNTNDFFNGMIYISSYHLMVTKFAIN